MHLFTDQLQHHFYDAFKPPRRPALQSGNHAGATRAPYGQHQQSTGPATGHRPAEQLNSPEMLQIMSANRAPAQAQPIALVYSGHQFGVWAGQLGDGRAMTLGELEPAGQIPPLYGIYNSKVRGHQPPTPDLPMAVPYCRSSIREYLCSEAMHGLGIATTRALCLVDSKSQVYREDDRIWRHRLSCCSKAIYALAPSNTFTTATNQKSVKALADYVIRTSTSQNGLIADR